jgi:hypothetical protein
MFLLPLVLMMMAILQLELNFITKVCVPSTISSSLWTAF